MIRKGNYWIAVFTLLISVLFMKLPVDAESVFTATAECVRGQHVKIHIVMDSDSSVDGIDIFRSEQQNGEYQLIGNMDFEVNGRYYYLEDSYEAEEDYFWYGRLRLVYEDTQPLTLYQTYYYQVKTYSTDENGQKTYLNTLDLNVTISSDGPIITSGVRSGTNKAKITWSKVDDADGYLIYAVQDYDKNSNHIYVDVNNIEQYQLVKTINNNFTSSATFSKLMNGVTYTYRIYAYKVQNGEKVLSISSEPKSVVMDYYSYDGETYEQRVKRAYGSEKKKNKNFKTASKAAKQMTTIKIKVWDFQNGKNGKKVTRTKWLTVNKRMAPSIKAMFDELYKSKEKQVIHDIGCYSYRTGQHMYGLAIDINANENYMVDGKTKIAGSFWNPKKSKYSIPLKCEFVRIMERYGFYRGFWGARKDYMHFSYFGT